MRGDNVVKEIQINNLRSLKDTTLQKITPITLLVGENSSGKSTFLRAFPLLKQSISRRTSGPILWAGDADDYVDFGSFDETVTNDGSNTISFRFKFDVEELGRFNKYVGNKNHKGDEEPHRDEIDYRIYINSENGKDFVSRFVLAINNLSYDIDLLEKGLIVDGKQIDNISDNSDEPTKQRSRSGFYEAYSRSFGFTLPLIDVLWKTVLDVLSTEDREKHEGYRFFELLESIGSDLSRFGTLKKPDEYKERTYRELYQRIYTKIQDEDGYLDAIKACYLYSIFPEIDEYIATYYRQVHYIAPLRATAERYYRLRNFAVDEVDYQGKNLAVFINSLGEKQLSAFNKWTGRHFGFSVSIDKSKGHLSLLIKVKDSPKAINLSDTGFGYSQVLPIITQLWVLSTKSRETNSVYYDDDDDIPIVVAIEQPELHLHPAIQAKLAGVFVASIDLARQNGYQLQLILETHSETIVNYLGRAIARGKLNKNDVSIILFEKDNHDSVTRVCNSSYDQDGFLENWPYGFFAAEE